MVVAVDRHAPDGFEQVRTAVAANVSGDNEIEGIDVLNGQVLLMMINNNSLSNDGFYLKDYTLTAGSEL